MQLANQTHPQVCSDRLLRLPEVEASITATEAGDLLPRSFTDATHFECRMCAWQDRCWKPQA